MSAIGRRRIRPPASLDAQRRQDTCANRARLRNRAGASSPELDHLTPRHRGARRVGEHIELVSVEGVELSSGRESSQDDDDEDEEEDDLTQRTD